MGEPQERSRSNTKVNESTPDEPQQRSRSNTKVNESTPDEIPRRRRSTRAARVEALRAAKWHYGIDENNWKGPFTVKELKTRFTSGTIDYDTWVGSGLNDWTEIYKVDGLLELLADDAHFLRKIIKRKEKDEEL